MGKTVLDWQFAIASLLAFAGVVVPVYFWQTDLSAHSLTVRLISSTVLELPGDSKKNSLQVIVNGSKIKSPHVYSLDIINTGLKSIPSTDFETPLEVRPLNDARLITAQVTGSKPKDMPVKILLENNKLKVLPFLSNPQDRVNITLVSSGQLDFKPTARIAGVSEVIFEDITKFHPRPLTAVFYGVLTATSVALYVFFILATNFRSTITIGPTIKILTAVFLVLISIEFGVKSVSGLNISLYMLAVVMFIQFAAGMTVGYFLIANYPEPEPEPDPPS